MRDEREGSVTESLSGGHMKRQCKAKGLVRKGQVSLAAVTLVRHANSLVRMGWAIWDSGPTRPKPTILRSPL